MKNAQIIPSVQAYIQSSGTGKVLNTSSLVVSFKMRLASSSAVNCRKQIANKMSNAELLSATPDGVLLFFNPPFMRSRKKVEH